VKRRPLDGILVADFSRVLAGPLCTQMLADAGARVIKVEEPGRGDETRRWGPPFVDGISAYFLSINRGKESVTLNLKSEDGRSIAQTLIAQADVVVENFLKAPIDFGTNERAVVCSIRGFDSDTPEAMTPGYDLLAQAGTGLMSITGDADGEPWKAGVALADVLTAHHAFGAINAALVARERTGRGSRVEVSLFSSTLASLVNVAQNVLVTGKEAGRYGNEHPSIVPYQLFHAKDRPFAIGAGTDRHFEQICSEVIGRPELARDRRFATNAGRVKHRGTLVPLLDAIFRTKTARYWLTRLRKANVPCSLVQGVLEALRSPAGMPLTTRLMHPSIGAYETVRYPVMFDGARTSGGSAPPELGQHTDKVLRDLGFTRAEVNRLRKSGAI
jgi:crotonobetainyl-CoA:carnitine CoA-transferase CaiB-like acyl-CoA transferase